MMVDEQIKGHAANKIPSFLLLLASSSLIFFRWEQFSSTEGKEKHDDIQIKLFIPNSRAHPSNGHHNIEVNIQLRISNQFFRREEMCICTFDLLL